MHARSKKEEMNFFSRFMGCVSCIFLFSHANQRMYVWWRRDVLCFITW